MSEYQYYEFLALDRPLTTEQMAQLRKLSTRATITPSRFTNVYHWGNFRGDPLAMMKEYFDAFVYLANWGSRHLMFKAPRQALPLEAVAPYRHEQCLTLVESGKNVILSIEISFDDPPDWDEEGEEWMPQLLALRQEIMEGDRRGLYLGWLAGAYHGVCEEDDVEPPVPPGLGQLSPALQALAGFLGIDGDLLTVAAAGSAPALPSGPTGAELSSWITSLPPADKDQLLLRVVTGEAAHVRAELLARYREQQRPAAQPSKEAGRTVGELLDAAEQRAAARERAEAARRAAQQAEEQRRKAEERARYLESLAGREPRLWAEAESLAGTKQPNNYDRAVQLLVDLRDLSNKTGNRDDFTARLADFRARHSRKPSLLNRLSAAQL